MENYVKIAIIGNILDFGAFTIDTDVGSLISSALERNLAVKDIDEFENALKNMIKYCIWLTIQAKLYLTNFCFLK